MKATAIIVNYYTAHLLPPLLGMLDSDPLISAILVADNSGESGLQEILQQYTKGRLLPFTDNLGFGAAINRAAKGVESEWLLVINPDTLPDEDCVEKLISGAEKSGAAIAGPRFYWDEAKTFRLPPATGYSWWIHAGNESSARFEADARLVSFYWDIRCSRFWSATEPFEEPFLSGACLLIRNDRKRYPGGQIFDERFFLYFEDTDLCIRAMKDNQTVVCVPDAYCVHYWDQSPREGKSARMAESAAVFRKKYYAGPMPVASGPMLQQSGFEDLGVLKSPPKFHASHLAAKRNQVFEISPVPSFIPAIQADMCGNECAIPAIIWERLPAGTYFTRVREKDQNQNSKLWTWKKE